MAKSRSADRQRYWRETIERQLAIGQSIIGFCSKEMLVPCNAASRCWIPHFRRLSNELISEMAISESSCQKSGKTIRSRLGAEKSRYLDMRGLPAKLMGVQGIMGLWHFLKRRFRKKARCSDGYH